MSDTEFLDGLIGRPITVSDRVRLFALARRGAERWLVPELSQTVLNQTARIKRFEAALREIAEENIGSTAALSVYIARAALEGK